MSFFEKLKKSLSITRKRFKDGLEFKSEQAEKFDESFFDEIEETLIVSDVGIRSAAEIIERLKAQKKKKNLKFKHELKSELIEILIKMLSVEAGSVEGFGSVGVKPRVILIFGVNGVGKTTTIAKLANFLKTQNKKVVLAAGDTYRAAAVEQLQIWSERVGCMLISHGQNCDPASVIFDAISYARKQCADFVLCDTAGRLHNNKNLMMQLEKIVRVARSEAGHEVESLLVVDATMGQNSLNQVEEFKKVASLNGIVLTKLDGTAKGGIAIAIAFEKQVPVRFLGIGEAVSDLQEFDARSFVKAIFD